MNVNKYCGAQDCPSQIEKLSNGTMVKAADQESVVLLMSIFSGAIFMSGLLIMVFVDNLEAENDVTEVKLKSRLLAVLRMSFKDKRMLFLLPIQVYASLFPGFVAVDFSKVFSIFLREMLSAQNYK